MTTVFAETILLQDGWQENVLVTIDGSGRIGSVQTGAHVAAAGADHCAAVLLPDPANLHSHAFQRAMAGLTESWGANPGDSF